MVRGLLTKHTILQTSLGLLHPLCVYWKHIFSEWTKMERNQCILETATPMFRVSHAAFTFTLRLFECARVAATFPGQQLAWKIRLFWQRRFWQLTLLDCTFPELLGQWQVTNITAKGPSPSIACILQTGLAISECNDCDKDVISKIQACMQPRAARSLHSPHQRDQLGMCCLALLLLMMQASAGICCKANLPFIPSKLQSALPLSTEPQKRNL